ncbi:MAG: Gfo/Idh/MocA family oxidoreductase, partial [Bacteroidales bacterium]
EGTLTIWGTDPQEEALKEGKLPGTPGWGTDPGSSWGTIHTTFEERELKGPFPLEAGNYLAYYDNIFGAIRNNDSLEVTSEQAGNVVRVIEAAYRSGSEGKVIPLQ